MSGERILIVDDALDTLEVLSRNLSGNDYRVLSASSVPEAVKVLEDNPVDLVITDLKMPKVSGLDLVRHVRENLPDTEVMMITGYATVEGAVEAVKTGAEEYLTKPFTDQELLSAVRRSLDKLAIRRARSPQASRVSGVPGLVGDSEAMQRVFSDIGSAATSLATVLITGESGTGKELVARAIHYRSNRATSPFVPVNCGGIPENLLESELFGHVKGAFTSAIDSRAGFFLTADGGTIFLDEISETSLAMQVKLLRVLEDKQVYLVGSQRPRQVDVRIIAATNKNLKDLVEKGGFREDLFFRLNVITIEVPPLRERGDDILSLVHHFSSKYSHDAGKDPIRFSEKTLRALQDYAWPGNVRELENLIQRITVMSGGREIEISDLPAPMRFSAPRENGSNRTLAEVEAAHIRLVLGTMSGNKTRAAEVLGIDRKTLREKCRRYSIE